MALRLRPASKPALAARRRCLCSRRGLSSSSGFQHKGAAFGEQKLSEPLTKALEAMKLEHMTEIQAKTLGPALEGLDVLGRARTGTGKTVAFLVPALENSASHRAPDRIDVLAISPTRELASQISEQGEQLLAFSPKRPVQVMFGGTKKPRDIRQLERNCPSLLVATPGRLLDHLQTTRLQNGKTFKDLVKHVQVLILDEVRFLTGFGLFSTGFDLFSTDFGLFSIDFGLFSTDFGLFSNDTGGSAARDGFPQRHHGSHLH